jgi:hypothetical protein
MMRSYDRETRMGDDERAVGSGTGSGQNGQGVDGREVSFSVLKRDPRVVEVDRGWMGSLWIVCSVRPSFGAFVRVSHRTFQIITINLDWKSNNQDRSHILTLTRPVSIPSSTSPLDRATVISIQARASRVSYRNRNRTLATTTSSLDWATPIRLARRGIPSCTLQRRVDRIN